MVEEPIQKGFKGTTSCARLETLNSVEFLPKRGKRCLRFRRLTNRSPIRGEQSHIGRITSALHHSQQLKFSGHNSAERDRPRDTPNLRLLVLGVPLRRSIPNAELLYGMDHCPNLPHIPSREIREFVDNDPGNFLAAVPPF